MALGPWISRALTRPLEFQGMLWILTVVVRLFILLLALRLDHHSGCCRYIECNAWRCAARQTSHFRSPLSRCFGAQAKPDTMMPSLHSAALTLRPEWAALVFQGLKTLELRAYSTRVQPHVWVPVLLSGESCVCGVIQLLGFYSHPNPTRPHRLSHYNSTWYQNWKCKIWNRSIWAKVKCDDMTSCCMFEYMVFLKWWWCT